MTSGRFATAVHALALLALAQKDVSSEWIAGSVHTHAVFLRRVLGVLSAAGLVTSRVGRGGGYRLARPAAEIRLDEVYRVMEADGPLAPCPAEPNARCPVGAGMRAAFAEIAATARRGVEASLADRTVADVAARALALGKEHTFVD